MILVNLKLKKIKVFSVQILLLSTNIIVRYLERNCLSCLMQTVGDLFELFVLHKSTHILSICINWFLMGPFTSAPSLLLPLLLGSSSVILRREAPSTGWNLHSLVVQVILKLNFQQSFGCMGGNIANFCGQLMFPCFSLHTTKYY